MRKILLATSSLFLMLSANAEKEVYVIKDGKMVNCEFVPTPEPEDESTIIRESVNEAGDPMVELKNPEKQYTSGMVYLPEAVDLNETWILEVEYYFNKDVNFSIEDTWKREGLVFDFMADTLPVNGTIFKFVTDQREYRIAHNSIDCFWRDLCTANSKGNVERDDHGVGVLRSVRKYVYSSPFLPKGIAERGDANKIKAIFMSIFSSGGEETSVFIKNMKFVSDGTKPFYADRMTILEGEGRTYVSTFSNYVYASNAEGKTVGELSYIDGELESPNKMYGQQLFVSQSPDGYYNRMVSDRLYCDLGEQAEADFYDAEYGFLPFLTKAEDRLDEDGILADAQIRIPFGAFVRDKISIAMRLGHNAGTSGGKTPYAEYIEKSLDIRFPVEYRFESGDAQKIVSKTEWKQFTPTYTKGGTDAVDSIPTMMTMVYGDVEIPSAEYSYITLRFVPNDVISYMFGDIRLTGDAGYPRSAADWLLGEDYLGNMIPVSSGCDCGGWGYITPGNDEDKDDDLDGVDNVVAKNAISIYLNPSTDVITVTNEGVESVAVYSVSGTLAASSESNAVNLANLSKGIYVVKANTEAGVITGQIVKK